MPRFVPDSRPISAQHPIAEFYREEFLKHHRCLQRQRPYYSESAITDVEAALSEDHRQARSALLARQRRTAGQLTPQEIRRRNRPFGLVRSQTHPLTRSHSQLRQDLLAIVRAGIGACAADALVERALRSRRPLSGALQAAAEPTAPLKVRRRLSRHRRGQSRAGRWPAAAARRSAPRIRAGLVIGVDAGGRRRPDSSRSSAAIRCRRPRAKPRAARRWRSPRRSPPTRRCSCSFPAARRR